VIKGERAGELVGVQGMSDGTQDQLYLALRLASIERYLEAKEPLPLILDDVLINFDDRRAAAALRTLAELGRKTQVIMFTHHLRLVELAQQELAPEDLALYLWVATQQRWSPLSLQCPRPCWGKPRQGKARSILRKR